jgi:hypothetical protein
MSRDQDSSKLHGEEKVAYAKEALAESISLLGAEVETRLKHTIDYAYERAEKVTQTVRDSAQKTRQALDLSRRVRASPTASIAAATLSGFAMAMFAGRNRRHLPPRDLVPPAQLAAALAAPKQQVQRASLLGSFAGSLVSHLADFAFEAAIARLSRGAHQGGPGARTQFGTRPDMH